jgi:dienelactone hydrolase
MLTAYTPVYTDEVEPGLNAIRYASEPYRGRDSWVFAYYARPKKGDGPFPAMLLVHGGGGKAFAEWAKLWADRGYVALAMDLAGNGPDGKPLKDGGPSQDDGTKFRPFEPGEVKDTWPYQAVAAVLRGHAFLANQKEFVDKDRIGITGISWGGYLTCIVAGIDDQLKVAVPVYGCGFLADNSAWSAAGIFDRLEPEVRERWIANFDPSKYLPGTSCPILFVNGTNDFAYPLDSYQKSYNLVKSPRTLCVTVNMPHGHGVGWAPQEIGAFVDSVLKNEPPLASVSPLVVSSENVSATYDSASPLAKAELHYSTDTGPWKDRSWKTIAAHINRGAKTITAELPATRPLVGFVTAVDERGLTVSTPHVELARD